MNEQFHTLIADSREFFNKRKLKKALNTAQIALEFGINEDVDPSSLILANLLLAKIYSTNGRYQNQSSFFQKSLKFLNDACDLNNHRTSGEHAAQIRLECGKIQLCLKNYQQADVCLNIGLELAKDLQNRQCYVQSLCSLSQSALEQGNIESSIQLAEKAMNYLNEHVQYNHVALWNEVRLQLSQAYINNKDYSQSLKMSQELLRSSKEVGDVEKEILALRNIAVVCGVKSNYKIGMQYFLDALDKCEEIGYRKLYIQLQVNIGTLYAHLYNYPEAIRRYQGVLENYKENLSEQNTLVVNNNLGNIYLSTNQPEKALVFFENARTLADQQQFMSMKAHSVAQISRTNLQLGRIKEAKKDASLAHQLINELGDINGKQINLLNLGEIEFHEKNLDEAQRLTLEAIETARSVKDDACEIRCFKHLAKIFKAKGDYKMALEYEEKYGEIQEAFAKEQYNRQFLNMEIRHAIKEKQKAIESLTKENEYQALLLKKSDQISTQNQELVRVNEDLKQFAYVASHDLKEPIRMIGAFSQIIREKTRHLLDEKEHQYFEFISGGVNRMNELLDGLLKYATVGNLERAVEEVDMNKVMMVCMANLHIRIQETAAEIVTDPLPVIQSNRPLIIQLFQNLISNALKFTKNGEQPVIKIGVIQSTDETTFYVKDNGIGISKKHQEKIFEIFQRLHTRTSYEGTGIGLAICQKIASRLNGRLWVESSVGKGATFYLTIPNNH